MTLTNPALTLTFTASDISGASTQTITYDYIVNRSVTIKRQLLNGLKSSSDTLSLQLARSCPSTEDIIVTEGDIRAVLTDDGTAIYTGYISTNFSWTVGQTGEQVLNITLESVGTRLLSQPYIDSGKIFFDGTASSIIYNVCSKAGIAIASGHERVLLQSISCVIDADTTCKAILDQLFYECNAAYYFNADGELCVYEINPDTSTYTTLDGDDLYVVSGKAISLSKKIRQYKGARIRYWVHGTADDYLVYRNTTDATDDYTCHLGLDSGEYFDGTEIYTSAEWSAALADTFRIPAYIGAVNASSESSIVGSNKIVSISNLAPSVSATSDDMSASFTNIGGGYFKLVAHNSGADTAYFTKLDLYASIVYQKSVGIIRTVLDGTSANKSLFEEELSWIHDKDNAQTHANMVSQYYQYSGSTYTFNSTTSLSLGSIVRLHDTVHSGLDVYVLVTGSTTYSNSDVIAYTAVGVSSFNLTEDVYYQVIEAAKVSSAGATGASGDSVEVEYALGSDPGNPPTEEMTWGSDVMYWDSETMTWDSVAYSSTIPTLVDGYYIWMRQRVGDGDWQYSRITGKEGTPAYVFDFTVSQNTYVRNSRFSDSTTYYTEITLTADVQGYSTTPSWSVTNGTLSAGSGSSVTLTIPYDNSYDTVTIVMSDPNSVASSVTKYISVIDETSDSSGMYLGELSAIPTTPTVGDAYISGDYFIASADFTGTDGNTYDIGVPYYYDGSDWYNTLELTDSSNVPKAIECLGGVMKAGIAVPSTSALWGWFKNLAAQTGVIVNFFSRNVTVGDGDGTSGSGFRFRAADYDSNGNKLTTPLFDVYYGDIMLFSVDSSGYIYFGSGFWYDPTDSAIHSTNDNVIIDNDGHITASNAVINGSSTFHGSFDCDVIKTVVNATTRNDYATSTTDATQGYNLAKALVDAGLSTNTMYSAEISGVTSDVAFISITTAPTRSYSSTYSTYIVNGGVTFYDSSYNEVDLNSYISISKRYQSTTTSSQSSEMIVSRNVRESSLYSFYNSYFCPDGFTLTIKTGGNVLQVDIPTEGEASGLSAGQLYYNSQTGAVHVKL